MKLVFYVEFDMFESFSLLDVLWICVCVCVCVCECAVRLSVELHVLINFDIPI